MMDYYHDCSDCRYEFDCNADIECDGDCEACEYSFQCAYCYYCTRRLETQSDVWYNVTREELHKNIAYCVKEKINHPVFCEIFTMSRVFFLCMILYYNNVNPPEEIRGIVFTWRRCFYRCPIYVWSGLCFCLVFLSCELLQWIFLRISHRWIFLSSM